MKEFIGKNGGRKFWGLMLYALATIFQDKLGITPEALEQLMKVTVGYTVAQGFSDGWSKGKTSSSS